jgi:hypothetical protein
MKVQLQIYKLTNATVRQDPDKFIIDRKWKTATFKNGWKE